MGAEGQAALLEQVRVSPGADEDYQKIMSRRIGQAVDQQEIPADVAFPVSPPLPLQRMVEPFRAKRGVTGDQQQHGRLQPRQIVPARAAQSLPVLEERLGVIDPSGWRGPPNAGRFLG